VETESEAGVIDVLARQGFTASFVAVPTGLRLLGSRTTFRPEEMTIRGYRRFEGVSDPDDMSIVYAVEATDGTRGTLVDAFGVYANPILAAVLDHITIRPQPGIMSTT
jgi:hypothetical protein